MAGLFSDDGSAVGGTDMKEEEEEDATHEQDAQDLGDVDRGDDTDNSVHQGMLLLICH